MFNILIIDDIAEKIYEIKEVIEELNLEIEIDYEMEMKKGCSRLKEKYYDLLILDVHLPSMEQKGTISTTGGVQLLRLITELDTLYKPGQIIGITAHSENYEDVKKEFNEQLWPLIKYDKASIDWKESIIGKIIYAYDAKVQYMKTNNIQKDNLKIDCAIITAVQNEWDQLFRCGIVWKEYVKSDDPTQYFYSEYEKDGEVINILIAKQSQMGMSAASMLTTKIINTFSPKLICMVGIAGGRKGEVELGDIIVAEESWDYGSGKIKTAEQGGICFSSEMHQLTISAASKEILNKDYSDILYKIRRDWNSGNGKKISTDIKVHVGAMASGAAVVQDEGMVTNYILPQHRKLLGIDMETYGVYYAAKNTTKKSVEAISVKAVSDFADPHKNDDYQHYAAYISTRFVLTNIHALLKSNC